jgi:hypothetical protein
MIKDKKENEKEKTQLPISGMKKGNVLRYSIDLTNTKL